MMIDDSDLDGLLNRLREEAPTAPPLEPGTVWRGVVSRRARAARQRNTAGWIVGVAVSLGIGVSFGRLTAPRPAPTATTTARIPVSARFTPEEVQLNLLAETSVDLFSTLAGHGSVTSDSTWKASVATMLWTTRRLLGAPALDASRQIILQDLELVLVQLLGVTADSDPREMGLARETILLRDMVSRLGALRTGTAAAGKPPGGSS